MMTWRFILTAFLLSSTVIPLSAQKPKDFGIRSKKALKLYFDGMEAARRRMRPQAIELFKQALDIEPEFGHAHYELGVNAYVQNDFEQALPHFRKAQQVIPGEFLQLPFFLGVTYFNLAKYDSAAAPLQMFLEQGEGRKKDLNFAAFLQRHVAFAREAILTPIDFVPENLGEAVNTDQEEYLPYLTADNSLLLFTARREENVGGYSSMLRGYSEDLFYSQWDGNAWGDAQNLGKPINSPENEGSASMTEDGRTVYFTACNLPGGMGGCDIYSSTWNGQRWDKPRLLNAPVNTEYWDGQACLSPDGRRLYFASTRPGGQGSWDIWYCERIGKRWGNAVNLGAPINTQGHEDSPFIHADGVTMYFSSDWHPGFGGEDLFVSYLDEDKGWSEPKNLGYPLNTVAVESNIYVSADGQRGFINSDREGGFGGSDIYTFVMDEGIRPQVATFLRGTVLDSTTKSPVRAEIRLVDVETGDTIRTDRSAASDGRFLMSLPLEREYAAFVQAPGYLFASQNFFLKDLAEETYFDLLVELSPIRKGLKVELKNIFFATDKYALQESSRPELAFLANYLKQTPRLRIEIQGHTDDVGPDAYNQTLSQNRANAVRTYLIKQGVASDRIEATGYGESQPIAGNDTPEGRAQNRRTEFKVLSAD